jgi:hypothetical protein
MSHFAQYAESENFSKALLSCHSIFPTTIDVTSQIFVHSLLNQLSISNNSFAKNFHSKITGVSKGISTE